MKKLLWFTALSCGLFLFSGCNDDLSLSHPPQSEIKPITSAELTSNTLSFVQKDKTPSAKFTSHSDPSGLTHISEGSLTAMLDYKEGQKQNIHLMVGVELDGKKVIYHFYKQGIVQKRQGNFYIDLQKKDKTPLYDKAKISSGDAGQKWLVEGYDEAFKQAYLAHPDKAKIYVAAVAGGDYYAKNDNYGSINYYMMYQTLYPGINSENYYVGTGDGTSNKKDNAYNSQIDGKGYLQPGFGVKLHIPVATPKWVAVAPEKNLQLLNYVNDAWKINLSSTHLMLKPYGQLVALIYYSKTPVEVNEIQLKFNDPGMRTDSYKNFNAPENFSIPFDTNISYDTNNFESEDPVLIKDSYLLNHSTKSSAFMLKVNGWEITKPYDNGYIGEPLFIWTHGKTGQVTIRANETPMVFDKTKNKYIVENDQWYGIFKWQNNKDQYYAGYYAGTWKESGTKEIKNLKNSISYGLLINKEQQSSQDQTNSEEYVNTGELLITEMLHNNPSNTIGNNYSMYEIYNPTDHDVDLSQYGLVTYKDIDNYRGKFEYNQRFTNATVQNLWGEYTTGDAEGVDNNQKTNKLFHFNDAVRDVCDNAIWEARRNRGRIMQGEYSRYIKPKKTIVLLAGHWVQYNDDLRGSRDGNGMVKQIIATLKKALYEGACQFVVALDNGEWLNGQGNDWSFAGKRAGVLQHAGTKGFALVKRVSPTLRPGSTLPQWRLTDVLGPTEKDLGYLKIDRSRAYYAYFGYGFQQYYTKKGELLCGWRRQLPPNGGDYKPTYYFYNQVRDPSKNGEKAGFTFGGSTYSIWTTYEQAKFGNENLEGMTPDGQSWGFRDRKSVGRKLEDLDDAEINKWMNIKLLSK